MPIRLMKAGSAFNATTVTVTAVTITRKQKTHNVTVAVKRLKINKKTHPPSTRYGQEEGAS